MKISYVKIRERIRAHKLLFAFYILMRLAVVTAMVLSIIERKWENVFVCFLVLAVYMLPGFIEDNFGIELPSLLEVIILLHVFAAEILGELSGYYVQYSHWDTLLHTTWGFLCAALGFSLVSILNRNRAVSVDLSPLYLALTAFCFSMTVGVIWEFFEFGADVFLHTDMQKDTVVHAISTVALAADNGNIPVIVNGITGVSVNGAELGLGGYLDIGLYDTMEDLLVNFAGAVVFSAIGYIDAKHPGRNRLARSLIPHPKQPRDAAYSPRA